MLIISKSLQCDPGLASTANISHYMIKTILLVGDALKVEDPASVYTLNITHSCEKVEGAAMCSGRPKATIIIMLHVANLGVLGS